MKSGLMKRVLAIGMIAMLLAGDVKPVLAQGVSDNNIEASYDTSEVSEGEGTEDSQNKDTSSEENSEDSITESGNEEDQSSETQNDALQNTNTEIAENQDNADTNTDVESEDTTVSGNEVIIEDEEVPMEEDFMMSLEPITVSGITITVSGPATAFAEGTTVSAVEVEPAEVVIEAAEENEEAIVKRYKAFDINLVLDGENVQPLNDEEITVNFEGDMLIPDEESNEKVAVYHVDDDDNIEKMTAEVASMEVEDEDEEVQTVEMTTTHFSTYVVMVTGTFEGEVNLTINHYYVDKNGQKSVLFLPDKDLKVENGGTISGFNKYDEYFDVAKVTIGEGKEETEVSVDADGKCTINADSDKEILNVYYSEIKDTANYGTTMFDYADGKQADSANSINYYKNYASYEPVTYEEAKEKDPGLSENKFNRNYNTYDMEKDQVNWKYRLAMIEGNGYYKTYKDGVNINAFNGDEVLIKGLLKGLDENGNPEFNDYDEFNKYEDPGFFTSDPKAGKKIIDGYELKFDRSGFAYELEQALKGETVVYDKKDGKEFFPLKGEPDLKGDEEYGDGGNTADNWFFGMRYDFEFVIGDYVGDMKYTFSGDDDLWVCLDGNVILDIGGIHGKLTDSVNIWKVLLGDDTSYTAKENYLSTEANRTKVHKITVLYMERGGRHSNCEMQFVMPNIVPTDPVITNVPKADLELIKKNSETQEVISGVGFTLYSDPECKNVKMHQQITGSEEGDAGRVSFLGLRAGTYYLKETTFDAENFLKNDTIYTVEVTLNADKETATATLKDADGKEVDKSENTYVVYNTPITPIDLEFYKVDRYTNGALNNVAFNLRKENAQGDVIDTATSNQDGYFKFEDIKAGVYYLEETTTLEGYKAPEKGWTVEVTLENGELKYEITDGPEALWKNGKQSTDKSYVMNEPYVSVEFTKVDAVTKKGMNGVEFKLYEGNVQTDNKLKGTVSSGETGVVTFSELLVGQEYLLVETTPEGYIAVETPWIVKVDYENNSFVQKIFNTKAGTASNTWVIVGTAYTEQVIENTPARGPLTITKTVDKVNEVHGVAAFTFKIECPDGNILYRTISFTSAGTKSVTIADLPYGEYKVTELSALRYTQTSVTPGNEVKIDSEEGAEVSFKNTKTFEELYSHTDVVVNKVVFNEDGSVSISKEKTSTSDVVNE